MARQKIRIPLNIVIILLLVVLVFLVIMGYWLHWGWTGLSKRTLWDWLQLLFIPVVLAVGGYLLNYTISRNEQRETERRAQTEREIAEKHAEIERYIALDSQCEAALQGYFDKMSELLLERSLRESQRDDEVRTIARVRTLTILSQLDANRKKSVMQFLHESNLISATNSPFQLKNTVQFKNIIPLRGADLDGANLIKAELSIANLSGAYLRGANLVGASLRMADLSRSYMTCANLRDVALKEAVLVRAKMGYTDLRSADLIRADLRDADLSGADLSGADLSGADLSGANITSEQLNQALSLKDTIMPDGSKHP